MGTVEILRSDELDTAQDSFQLLKTLAWVLPLFALAAFALGAWLSGDRRRAMHRIGITAIVVGVIGIVAANVVGAYVVDHSSPRRRTGPPGNAWDILNELLRSSYRWLIVGGVLFLVAAWLAGPGRWAFGRGERSRRRSGSGSGHMRRCSSRSSSSSRGRRLRRYLFVLVFVALGVAWIELMRTQALAEFPDATAPSSSPMPGVDVTGWWEARRAGVSVGEPAPTPSSGDIASRLASLADLHARGELSEEFASAKNRVLEGGVGGQAQGGGCRIHGHGFVQPGGGGTRPRRHMALRGRRSALRALLRVERYERRLAGETLRSRRRRTTFSFLLRIVLALIVLIGVWSVLSVFPRPGGRTGVPRVRRGARDHRRGRALDVARKPRLGSAPRVHPAGATR